MTVSKFRRRAAQVEAVQWTGDNEDELKDFTNNLFYWVDPEDRDDDPDMTAACYSHVNGTWEGVREGDWIVKEPHKLLRLYNDDEFDDRFVAADGDKFSSED